MNTVYIKWRIVENQRHQVKVYGVVADTEDKKNAEKILFYNIFVFIKCALDNNGRLKPLEQYPNMEEITAYFEISFNSRSDVNGFIEAVKRES